MAEADSFQADGSRRPSFYCCLSQVPTSLYWGQGGCENLGETTANCCGRAAIVLLAVVVIVKWESGPTCSAKCADVTAGLLLMASLACCGKLSAVLGLLVVSLMCLISKLSAVVLAVPCLKMAEAGSFQADGSLRPSFYCSFSQVPVSLC